VLEALTYFIRVHHLHFVGTAFPPLQEERKKIYPKYEDMELFPGQKMEHERKKPH
jgi:hypothetical protein